MNKKYTILIIDDTVENLQYLSKILEYENYDIRATKDVFMGIEATKKTSFDLILLDIKMPEIDGYSACKQIKENTISKDTPVIFISAFDDIEHKVKAFENGGVDYITKPFEPKEVIARIKTQIQIFESKKTIQNLLAQQDMFIKKIMHEMNTPLSVISLNAGSLENKYPEQKELKAIKASTKTLSSIYGDLSYMIKKEKNVSKKEFFEVVNFISNRLLFFDEIAKVKDIHFEIITEKDIEINMDKNEFERVIDNLISNAIKYSNEDSFITISIFEEDSNTYICIEDEGIGIENTDELFTAYYQSSEDNVGLGLGLNIVKDICDKNQIEISVDSTLNEGTKFTLNINSIKVNK